MLGTLEALPRGGRWSYRQPATVWQEPFPRLAMEGGGEGVCV